MIRIGFDGRALTSPAAGVRRYACELFGALAALPDCEVIAVGAVPLAGIPAGVHRGPSARSLPTNLGWMTTGLPRAARRARLDIFHAPGYTAPFGGVRPLVVTLHDVSYERRPEWYPYRRDPLRRAFYRASAHAADAVITDSAFSKTEIVAAYGLPPERIAVVPLAAAASFTPGPAGRLPAGVPRRYLLHVGDLHPRRNLEVALRALVTLQRRRHDLRDVALVLAGADRGSAAGLRALAGSGSSSAVVFAGPVDEAGLVSLYRGAVALVYPSRYEGFGLPLLEAMACACPVLASAAASLPEVTGEAAVLLPPDDEGAWERALEHVLDSGTERERLRRAGLERAAQFSWRRSAQATLGVYRRLLERQA